MQAGLADCVTYYPNTYVCEFIQTLKTPWVDARDTVNRGSVPDVCALLLFEQITITIT